MDPRLVDIVDQFVVIAESCPQDLTWQSHYADQREFVSDLRDHAERMRGGDGSRLPELTYLLLPTGAINEIALSSGWGRAYLVLANRFDELCPGRTRSGPAQA